VNADPRGVWARRAVCAGGLLLLLVWQLALFRMPWPEQYEFRASSGMSDQGKFVYFLYYTNNFPIASTRNGIDYEFYYTKAGVDRQPNTLAYSAAAAERLLRNDGDTLVMEWGHILRSGQLLSTYLYLPDAWRLGSPQFAEVRMTHGALFIAGLASVYLMSWWLGMPVFGVVFVVLVGSDPFQLYEAYRHENSFSWPITSLCFTLALALPILTGRRLSPAYAAAVAVAAGIFAATANQIRPEPIMLLGGVTLALLCAASLTWRARLLTIALLILTTFLGLRAWDRYFDRKFDQAARVVTAAGGHVLPAPPGHYHAFWHAIWCGLSDFDTTHGYAWSDSAALAYAQPVLEARYGEQLPWWWGVRGKDDHERTADDYLDADHVYYQIPFRAPHYEEVMRDKVLGDIAHDPIWFAGILSRRVLRLFTETTRPQLTLSTAAALPLPFSGLLVAPLALAAGYFRRWTDLKILMFSFAVSLPVLLVFSGRGMTDYSAFHLCALALTAAAVAEYSKAHASRA
jgi:hypothetical protein